MESLKKKLAANVEAFVAKCDIPELPTDEERVAICREIEEEMIKRSLEGKKMYSCRWFDVVYGSCIMYPVDDHPRLVWITYVTKIDKKRPQKTHVQPRIDKWNEFCKTVMKNLRTTWIELFGEEMTPSDAVYGWEFTW